MECNKLEQEVMSEAELLAALGLTKKQLDHLRWQKSFPCVALSRTVRVYVVEEVVEYIERLARDARYASEVRAIARQAKKSAG